MLNHGLFSLLTERLMLHSAQFSMTTYNVLFEVSAPSIKQDNAMTTMFNVYVSLSVILPLFRLQILAEQICTQVIHKQHPEPDSTVKIINPRKCQS